MKHGSAPIVDGGLIQIHHVGQKEFGPLAEIPTFLHQLPTMHELGKKVNRPDDWFIHPSVGRSQVRKYWIERLKDAIREKLIPEKIIKELELREWLNSAKAVTDSGFVQLADDVPPRGPLPLMVGAETPVNISESDDPDVLNGLRTGVFFVAIEKPEQFDVKLFARLADAVLTLNAALATHGTQIVLTTDAAAANVVIQFSADSACGNASAGVLGCHEESSELITFITGWKWFVGPNPDEIGAAEYDFQTIVTHELGHAVGLDHVHDPRSAMYPLLSAGSVRRELPTVKHAITESHSGCSCPACQALARNAGCQPGNTELPAGSSAPPEVVLPETSGTARKRAFVPVIIDEVDVVPRPEVTVWIAGGVSASSSDDILLGGAGDDIQVGLRGHDVLIGGIATSPATDTSHIRSSTHPIACVADDALHDFDVHLLEEFEQCLP